MCPTWVIAQIWRHGGNETGLAEQFLQDRWQQWAAVTSDLSWEGLTRSHAAWWVDIARQNLKETQNVPSHMQTGVKSKSHLHCFHTHTCKRQVTCSSSRRCLVRACSTSQPDAVEPVPKPVPLAQYSCCSSVVPPTCPLETCGCSTNTNLTASFIHEPFAQPFLWYTNSLR